MPTLLRTDSFLRRTSRAPRAAAALPVRPYGSDDSSQPYKVMKSTSLFGALALLASLTTGCDQALPSDTATETLVGPQASARVANSVSGGGADFYPSETDDISFRITFNARSNVDGALRGRVHWTFPDGRLASQGDVYCLDVRGNRAYMAYRATAGEFGGYGELGNSVVLGFEDNGEGAGSPLDRQSFIYFGIDVDLDCSDFGDFVESGAPGSGFPVEWVRGNVQVR